MAAELKEARLNKNLTVEDVAMHLNIKKQYIIALEESDYDALPGNTYVKGYLRTYSRFLGITLSQNDEELKKKTVFQLRQTKDNPQIKRLLIIICILMLVITIIVYDFLYDY